MLLPDENPSFCLFLFPLPSLTPNGQGKPQLRLCFVPDRSGCLNKEKNKIVKIFGFSLSMGIAQLHS